MRNFENRIRRLEKNIPADSFSDIQELIQNKVFYDELTPEQRQRYIIDYHELPSLDIFEEIHLAACGDLHFPLKKKEKPLIPGSPEFRARVQEIEDLFNSMD